MPRLLVRAIAAMALTLPAVAQPEPRLPTCPEGPLFDTLPIAPEDFLAFRPLGFLSLPIHIFPAKHSSFTFVAPGQPAPERTVRFPGRVWVTQVTSTRFPNGNSGYQMVFYACREFRSYLYHLKDINESVKAAFEAGEKRCYDYIDMSGTIVKCDGRLFHEVQGGEIAGLSGDGSSGVDFGANDLRVSPRGFLNLPHYSFDYPYYVSPIDYFPPESKRLFEAKLASFDGAIPRTAEPRAGSYRPDVEGTAQGNWFYPGTYQREATDLSPSVALVHDYIDPAQPVFSIGTKVEGVRMGLYTFEPRESGAVNRDFTAIVAGAGPFCYEGMRGGWTVGKLPTGTLSGVLLAALDGEGRLRLERKEAATCDAAMPWTFSDAAAVFER